MIGVPYVTVPTDSDGSDDGVGQEETLVSAASGAATRLSPQAPNRTVTKSERSAICARGGAPRYRLMCPPFLGQGIRHDRTFPDPKGFPRFGQIGLNKSHRPTVNSWGFRV